MISAISAELPIILMQTSDFNGGLIQFIIDNKNRFLIAYILIFLVFYGIATMEGLKRAKILFCSDNRNLIAWSIGLFVGILVLLRLIQATNIDSLSIVVVFIIKGIIPFFVSSEAKRAGRNKVLWWFLGFIEFHLALIVLGLTPSLIESKKYSEESTILNSKYKNLMKTLKGLKQSGNINPNENRAKKKALEEQYHSELDLIIEREKKSQKNSRNDEVATKLLEAYKSGLLTQEEYNTKLEELRD